MMRIVPKILIVPGSNRSGSHNARLAGTISRELVLRECEITRINLLDFEMPLLDIDLETRSGPPINALRLARMFEEHDGIILVSPEYNASVPPLVKNTVDWVSRVKSDSQGSLAPFTHKVFALASASPGRYGGMRGLYHLRASLMAVGALIITEQLSIGFAANAFDEMDRLTDEQDRRRLDVLCGSMLDAVHRFSVRL